MPDSFSASPELTLARLVGPRSSNKRDPVTAQDAFDGLWQAAITNKGPAKSNKSNTRV